MKVFREIYRAKKAGENMKLRHVLMFVLSLSLVVALGVGASAQERITDTLRVQDANIEVGDTGFVFIYFANTDTLGSYTIRVRYDPAVLGVVTIPDQDSTAQMEVVRGAWTLASGGLPEAGILTAAVAFPQAGAGMATIINEFEQEIVIGMDAGRGNTLQFEFFPREGVTAGTQTQIVFEDAPYDSNAYNWFANWTGLYQYRPMRVAGTITIGGATTNNDPTITPLSSPVEASVGIPLNFTVNAQDQDVGDVVTLTAFDLPSGATFSPSNPVSGTNSTSGTFGWTPSISQVGQHTVRFRAEDDHGGISGYTSVVINVSSGGSPTIAPLASPLTVNQGDVVEFSVQAQDPEGEEVTLTATNLPPGGEFTPSNPVIGIGTVSGIFRWSPNFTQVGLFTVQFQAEDEIGNKSSVNSVTIDVREVVRDQLFTTSVVGQSPQGGVPGLTGVVVPVNFVTTVDCYGVQFDMIYDPTVFTVTDIVPTVRLDGFSVYEDIGDTPGRIKVVTFSLSGNPIGDQGSVIFNVEGRISPTALPGRYNLLFEDAWESINSDASVPSKDLATSDGHLFVDNLGDANLDGTVNVADPVTVVANILGTNSFTARNFGAANVVTDPSIDVYDLVGIVNIIFGDPIQPAPFNDGSGDVAEIDFAFHADEGLAGAYRLLADSPADVAGIQAEIIYDPLQVQLVPPEPSSQTAQMDMSYNDNGDGRMTVILYTLDKDLILPMGNNEIFGVKIVPGPAGIEGDLPPVELRDIRLSTPEASKILTETDVPRTFELFQNYPNPFNPRTVIEFSLTPQDDGGGLIDTKVEVFNILGQKIATLVDASLMPGRHSVEWMSTTDEGRPVGSGIYFYKLSAGTQSETKKMVLLK